MPGPTLKDAVVSDIHAPVYVERTEGVLDKLEMDLEGLGQLERLNELMYAQVVISHEVADLLGVSLEI